MQFTMQSNPSAMSTVRCSTLKNVPTAKTSKARQLAGEVSERHRRRALARGALAGAHPSGYTAPGAIRPFRLLAAAHAAAVAAGRGRYFGPAKPAQRRVNRQPRVSTRCELRCRAGSGCRVAQLEQKQELARQGRRQQVQQEGNVRTPLQRRATGVLRRLYFRVLYPVAFDLISKSVGTATNRNPPCIYPDILRPRCAGSHHVARGELLLGARLAAVRGHAAALAAAARLLRLPDVPLPQGVRRYRGWLPRRADGVHGLERAGKSQDTALAPLTTHLRDLSPPHVRGAIGGQNIAFMAALAVVIEPYITH